MNKEYLHMDEAFSFGLASYDKVTLEDNEDFYNTWHTKSYYEDYLSVGEDEIGSYRQVYENQKNDVHPPLYYLILRFAMGLNVDHFSKWTGIIINIIIYAFVTIVMYLILKKLFKDEKMYEIKSAILALVSSMILASLSNVVNIRMYALLTFEVLLLTFLHTKLLESTKVNYKLLTIIGITVLAGVLTHYYFIIYLFFLYLFFFIKYIKEKRIKELVSYTITMIISGTLSLIIFPYSISHIFFGERGTGAISSFEHISKIIHSLSEQTHNLNLYAFNYSLFVILGFMAGLIICKKINKKDKMKIEKGKKEILNMIFYPSICFFIISAMASPWDVLRYFVPVCGLIFVVIIYEFYRLLKTVFTEKTSNSIIILTFCFLFISPFVLKLEPELLYRDRKELVERLDKDLNLPSIYLYSQDGGRFLDDILLFTKLDESYISNGIEINKENIEKIVENKDISKGIILFINQPEGNENIAKSVKDYLNFENLEHLKWLRSCDVYYLH